MPFAELPDARIHYSLTGLAGVPVIVFSNSLGATLSMWDIQASALGNRFRILRYDTRGHGQSSATPGPYSIEQLGKDVTELMDSLRIDRVHFCGLSMGGQIGQWLGLNAAARLQKLILCNTGAKIGNEEGWNKRIEIIRTKGMKAVAPSVVARWFTPPYGEKHPEVVASSLRTLEATDRDGYAACCEALREFDARDSVARIRVPTLVISGSHDSATAPELGRFLAEKIADARYTELSAAHLSNIEDAERFNCEVAEFLAH
jgi:3-oxoadipate enol-lactonase